MSGCDEIGDEAKRLDAITRRIADCLQAHLHEHGWEPYRYPSGEHKGVELMGGEIYLYSAPSKEEAALHPVSGTGESFVITVTPGRVRHEAWQAKARREVAELLNRKDAS